MPELNYSTRFKPSLAWVAYPGILKYLNLYISQVYQIIGLVQDCDNSIASTLDLPQSCAKLWK